MRHLVALLAFAVVAPSAALRFVYLIQSEEYTDLDGIQSAGGNVEVIVLTFKVRSERPNAIWYPNSTLSSGRNRLLDEATKDGLHHDFYIFADDDITLLHRDRACHVAKKPTWCAAAPTAGDSPVFREFEAYLEEYLPAVAAPSYPSWGPAAKTAMSVQSVGWFDTLTFAVHRDALKVVLPFYTGLDFASWWHAVYFFNEIARTTLGVYNMQINELIVRNDEERHRPKVVQEGFHDRYPWFLANFGCTKLRDKMHYPNHEFFLHVLYEPQGDLLAPPASTAETYSDTFDFLFEECAAAPPDLADYWTTKAQFWCTGARGHKGDGSLHRVCQFPGCVCPNMQHGFLCTSNSFAEWEHALREYPDLPDLCRADAVLLELGEYESESDASS